MSTVDEIVCGALSEQDKGKVIAFAVFWEDGSTSLWLSDDVASDEQAEWVKEKLEQTKDLVIPLGAAKP